MIEVRGARFHPIARTTLPQTIIKTLIDRLQTGVLHAGDALPTERELSEQLGVGRTSVREALQALALVGIVEARPGGGTFITMPQDTPLLRPLGWRMLLNPERVLETVDARVLIESELAAQAAVRQDAAAIADVGEQLELMRQVVAAEPFDAGQYLAGDVAFHLAIARAAQNSVLQEIMMALRSLLHSFIERNLELQGRGAAELANPHHDAIYEAIRSGDAQGARQAMVHHIKIKGKILAAAVEGAGEVQLPD